MELRDVVEYLPPAFVSGGLVLGLQLNEWVQLLTIVYVLVGTVCAIKRAFFPKIPKDQKGV